MTFRLSDLVKSSCQNLWHDLLAIGSFRNGTVDVDETAAQALLARCNEAPPSVDSSAPALFTARQRNEVEKNLLRALCAICKFNQGGQCLGSNCCGGRIPVEVKLNLTTTRCPKGKWPPDS